MDGINSSPDFLLRGSRVHFWEGFELAILTKSDFNRRRLFMVLINQKKDIHDITIF